MTKPEGIPWGNFPTPFWTDSLRFVDPARLSQSGWNKFPNFSEEVQPTATQSAWTSGHQHRPANLRSSSWGWPVGAERRKTLKCIPRFGHRDQRLQALTALCIHNPRFAKWRGKDCRSMPTGLRVQPDVRQSILGQRRPSNANISKSNLISTPLTSVPACCFLQPRSAGETAPPPSTQRPPPNPRLK